MALAALFVYHLLELVIEQHETPGRFYVQHPWFLFTALVSVVLSLGHLALMVPPQCMPLALSASDTPHARKRVEILFFSLDGAWALLWVLQCLVQALLPQENRAFSLEAVAAMMVLYALQAAFSAPLVYYLYVDWRSVGEPDAPAETDAPAPTAVRTPVRWLLAR